MTYLNYLKKLVQNTFIEIRLLLTLSRVRALLFNLNRTDIIIESIKSYIAEQESRKQYDEFDGACKELKDILDNPEKIDSLQTLDELLDEL